MNINWYPGHMKKTIDQLHQSLRMVDIVVEIIDARIPVASRNPKIDELTTNKPRLIILNKYDLSDRNENIKWLNYLSKGDVKAICYDSLHENDISSIYTGAKSVLSDNFEKRRSKGITDQTIRMMVVGIPNVGKSTFINNISKRKGTKVGNRPGVTRTNQWIKTDSDLLLLDTPGVLWPKFETETIAMNLAFTGAIKDEIMDIETLCFHFINKLNAIDPALLSNRYDLLDIEDKAAVYIMDAIGSRIGAIVRGGDIDYFKVANKVFDDFRKGRLGRITLERVGD